jgi:hypothetical protein
MYFLSYLAILVLALFALALGGVALLVQWLTERRPWQRLLARMRAAREERDRRVTPHDPIMRFPSRP